MRVTDTALFRQFLGSLSSSRSRAGSALNAIADGKRVRTGSDDPAGARISIELRGRLVRTEGYLRSGASARFDLSTIDNAISEVTTVLIDVRSKALAGASSVADDAGPVLAAEIDEFRDALLALANSEQGGRHLFGGTETLTAPFDSAGVYAGNGDATEASLDSGSSVEVTLDGSDVFQGAGDIFQTLSDLSTALVANDSVAIQGILVDLNNELDHLGEVHTRVGTRLQSIDQVRNRILDEQVLLQERVIEIEGADLAELAVELSSAANSSDALSAAGARVLGRSLFDFLG